MVILRAWKNLISDGSRPVGPALTVTSTGDTYPTFALHGIVKPSICAFMVDTAPLVKSKATLPFIKGNKFLSYGNGFQRFFLYS